MNAHDKIVSGALDMVINEIEKQNERLEQLRQLKARLEQLIMGVRGLDSG